MQQWLVLFLCGSYINNRFIFNIIILFIDNGKSKCYYYIEIFIFLRGIMNDKLIWVWLSLHFGVASKVYQRLYAHFGSVENIYDSDDADVEMINWLYPAFKSKLLDKNLSHAEQIVKWCEDHDVEIITPSDENYPSTLRLIDNYPAVLYCRGKLPDFQKVLPISVVGTRNMTIEGQNNAYNLGYGLAKGGALVISGMALGIDCTAQKGALYAGGSSIAVLGSGIDVCYPKENRKLMEKIAQVGAVITEFPPHTPPTGSNFPKRNRIISALSLATVVVEADRNSGALITANKAKEQGRMLFAYPGSVNEYRNEGANMLLQEGAKVATSAIDILEQFLDRYSSIINLSASKEKPVINRVKKVASSYDAEGFYRKTETASIIDESAFKKFDSSTLTEEQLIIYNGMEYNKTYTMDELLNIGSNPNEIASTVMMLQLAGAIENVPGGYYIKK